MPKVTILTPAFNSAKYIGETIESAMRQTYQDFEMVIVDDGSMDDTKKIIESYAQKYPGKIRYIFQKNAGPSAARNTAIKNSSGEYLATLDADDLWLPNRLEEGVKVLESQPDVGLVHSRTQRLINGKLTKGAKREPEFLSGMIFKNLILRRAHISCLSVLVRRKCVEEAGMFDESRECSVGEDRDLWIRISKKNLVQYIDQELGIYRMLSTGISRNAPRMLESGKYVINKNCPGLRYFLLRRCATANIYKENADEYFQNHDFQEAKKKYMIAISFWPFYVWPWINYVKCLLKTGDKDVG